MTSAAPSGILSSCSQTPRSACLVSPKAARDAGATKIVRCGKTTFSVGYTLADGDLDQPGNGTAVVAALRTWAGNDFQVEWDGRQGSGIILIATT